LQIYNWLIKRHVLALFNHHQAYKEMVLITKFKFKASQARSIYRYKKLKIKVLNYNADIFFNKQYTLINTFGPGAGHLQFSEPFMYNVNIL